MQKKQRYSKLEEFSVPSYACSVNNLDNRSNKKIIGFFRYL